MVVMMVEGNSAGRTCPAAVFHDTAYDAVGEVEDLAFFYGNEVYGHVGSLHCCGEDLMSVCRGTSDLSSRQVRRHTCFLREKLHLLSC